MAEPDELLGAKLSGTARLGTRAGQDDTMIVEHLRDLARGRADVLRREAARAIGGWLGLPVSPDLRIGYRLLEAAAIQPPDAGVFIAEADTARRRVGGSSHGASDAHGYKPPAG